MTIEVPPAEVYALASGLRSASAAALEIAGRLDDGGGIGGPLQPAVDAFLEAHRTAAGAMAGELDWLAGTIAGVVDSWLGLDGALLPPRGRPARR